MFGCGLDNVCVLCSTWLWSGLVLSWSITISLMLMFHEIVYAQQEHQDLAVRVRPIFFSLSHISINMKQFLAEGSTSLWHRAAASISIPGAELQLTITFYIYLNNLQFPEKRPWVPFAVHARVGLLHTQLCCALSISNTASLKFHLNSILSQII